MTGLQLPHDIIEPAPIGWWPLAPGWWLLIGIAVIGLLALAIWFWQRWRKLAPLRQAQHELRALESQWQQQRDNRATSAALSALLKRIARCAYPADNSASLTGTAWQAFLLRTGDGAFDNDSVQALQQFYQAEPSSPPPFAAAAAWLRAQRRALLQQVMPLWRSRHV